LKILGDYTQKMVAPSSKKMTLSYLETLDGDINNNIGLTYAKN
jgi:hypothetical protein